MQFFHKIGLHIGAKINKIDLAGHIYLQKRLIADEVVFNVWVYKIDEKPKRWKVPFQGDHDALYYDKWQ